jgi:hypothetical protein
MSTRTTRTTRNTGVIITMVLVLTGWGLMGAVAPVGNAQADQPKIVVSINNGGGVRSGPTAPSTFVTNESWLMTEVWTYHWNGGRGASPGQISIEDTVTGKVFGPWPTRGEPGQGGVLNAYWVARPDMVLPAGSYRFVDSDPSTWAQNAESGGRGFAWIYARPATAASAPTGTASPTGTAAVVASMDGVERGTCSKVSVLWETYSGAWTVTTKSKSALSANARILNEPQQEARPRFTSPVVVTRVETYHWNGGLGDTAGTIELRRDAGALFPPWPTQAVADTKGNRNVIWRADTGGVVAPAGTYTLIDSRRPTWSTNKTAKLAGIARVLGCKRPAGASSGAVPATTAPGRVTPTSVVGVRSLPGGCTSPRPISPFAGLTALPMTAAGRYSVYWGASGADGLQTPATWEVFGPFDLRSGSRYKATLGANGGMQWVENPAEVLGAGAVGAGFAVVHAAQDRGASTATFWTVAVCSGAVAAAVDTPATSAAPATGCAAIPGVWSWFTNGDVTFRADGTLTQGSLTGRWTCTDGRVSVSWSHGYYDTLTLSADGRSLSGFGSTDSRATSGFSVSGRKK